MRARRKLHNLEDDKLDRWLISYADFITLLFAFFVVLYAISSINEQKYEEMTTSLIQAFDVKPKSLEPIQVGEVSRDSNDNIIRKPLNKPGDDGKSDEIKNLRNMANAIEREMLNLLTPEDVTIRRSDQWLEIEFDSRILFPSGSANLVSSSNLVLTKIAGILSNYPNPINVEGFTDDVPISTERFPSNWELSASRAASVVHLFSQHGIKPDRMAAIAYGQWRPVADNKTLEGRRANRRVVIAVLASDLNMQTQRKPQKSDKVR